MKFMIWSVLIVLVSGCSLESFGQTQEDMPFLVCPSSPSGNGMGSLTGVLSPNDATAPDGNPGILGLTALEHHWLGQIYPDAVSWSPDRPRRSAFRLASVEAGLIFSRRSSSPTVAVGVAFSNGTFDAGLDTIRDEFQPHSTWGNRANVNAVSVSIGIRGKISFGIGMTGKSFNSIVTRYNDGRPEWAWLLSGNAYDVGMACEVPLTELIFPKMSPRAFIPKMVVPFLNVHAGLAVRNIGNELSYGYHDWYALPRHGVLGWRCTAGLQGTMGGEPMEFVTMTVAREADDDLVRYTPEWEDTLGLVDDTYIRVFHDKTLTYADGVGSIKIWQNVIAGEGSDRATVHKGGEITILECLTLRGGSVTRRTGSYTTTGWGVRLTGVLKFINSFASGFGSSKVGSFLLDHLDVRYDSSRWNYDAPNQANDGLTFEGFSVAIHN